MEHVFSDVTSGKHESRPGMDQMLAFLNSRKDQNYAVIIDDISRLARSIMAHMSLRAEISAAGGELMSPSIEFSDNPTAQLPEKMMALIVEQERITNAARSKSRSMQRLKAGYWVFSAPVGFKYVKDTDGSGGKVLVRDEPVASVVADALNKFASGYFETQAELRRHLLAHPVFPKSKTGRLGKDMVKQLLIRPHYAGYILHDGWGVPLMKAKHEPLIAYETYLKIQDRLNGKPKNPVRLSINPSFPLRGLVECADCAEPLKAAFSQGRSKKYGYYACHTKTCDSYGKSTRKETVENDFEALIEDLRPSTELLDVATMMFKDVWDRHVAAFKERQTAAHYALKGVEQKIDTLVSRLVQASQPALINVYERELGKLESQKVMAHAQIAQTEEQNGSKMPDFDEAYRTTLEMLKNPVFLWHSPHVAHKRALVKLAFGHHLKYCRNGGYRTAQLSLPFQVIQSLSTPPKEGNMHYIGENEEMVPEEATNYRPIILIYNDNSDTLN